MKTIVWAFQAVCLLGLVGLSGCTSPMPASTAPTRLGTSQDQASIQVLHRRLHERERTIARQKYQIEVLSGQLDALKQIDQDTRGQWRPVHNSMTVTP
jgi:TolA-binding protein